MVFICMFAHAAINHNTYCLIFQVKYKNMFKTCILLYNNVMFLLLDHTMYISYII